MTPFSKNVRASVKDVDGELIFNEKRKPIKLGEPIEIGIRGENVDLYFAVPKKHWHRLQQATLMRTRMGTKSFTTYCPGQPIPEVGTMTIVQRVQFHRIDGNKP